MAVPPMIIRRSSERTIPGTILKLLNLRSASRSDSARPPSGGRWRSNKKDQIVYATRRQALYLQVLLFFRKWRRGTDRGAGA